MGGSKWKPLSARTLAGRKKSGRGAKILRDTGRLSMSFVSGGSSNIFRIGPQSVTVGTEVDYAEQHEKGIDVPKRKMLPTKLKAKALAKAEVMAIYRKATR